LAKGSYKEKKRGKEMKGEAGSPVLPLARTPRRTGAGGGGGGGRGLLGGERRNRTWRLSARKTRFLVLSPLVASTWA